MPDKRNSFHCGSKDCLRCWRNKMKHGCPQAQKWLKEHAQEEAGKRDYQTIVRGKPEEVKKRTSDRTRYEKELIQ